MHHHLAFIIVTMSVLLYSHECAYDIHLVEMLSVLLSKLTLTITPISFILRLLTQYCLQMCGVRSRSPNCSAPHSPSSEMLCLPSITSTLTYVNEWNFYEKNKDNMAMHTFIYVMHMHTLTCGNITQNPDWQHIYMPVITSLASPL